MNKLVLFSFKNEVCALILYEGKTIARAATVKNFEPKKYKITELTHKNDSQLNVVFDELFASGDYVKVDNNELKNVFLQCLGEYNVDS